jgi:hypothetical protein
MVSPNNLKIHSATNFKNVSSITAPDHYVDSASQQVPQRAYKINENYFIHVDQKAVPFNLDDTYFAHAEVRGDGLYFRIHKETKAAGSAGYQTTNPADNSKDSFPNYHLDEHE